MNKQNNNLAVVPDDENTAPKFATMPGSHGGTLRRGNPGNKGGGRPADAWKAACRKLASNNEILKTARRILRDPDHPAWIGAWKFVAEHGYGKPVESKEVRRRNELVIRVVREGE